MKASLKLGRIAGIEIGVHYTLIFAALLIAWSLFETFRITVPGSPTGYYWAAAIGAALFLFVSVLLHELAHSLVARSRGLGVSSIVLFIFGGVSNLQEEPKSPGTEFVMAFVGPGTSLVLGGILWGIGASLGVQGNPFAYLFSLQPQSSVGLALISYLASINILLGIFNLIPGFPLDGGRVLRSIIWGSTGNLRKSTNIAALTGRYIGWGFIAYGVYQLIFQGNLLGGIWIAFIGWFLASAADSSRRDMTMQEQLAGVKVKDIMNATPITVVPGTSVERIVNESFLQCRCRAVPVMSDGRLTGIVTLDDIKKVPREKWVSTPATEIMTREQQLITVSPEDDLIKTMRLLGEQDFNQLPVMQDGRMVGLISRSDVIRRLQIAQELEMQAKRDRSQGRR